MSEIREKLEDLLYKSVINAEEIDITADKLFKSFHISEKLTEEEMELIKLCQKHKNNLGASRQDMNNLLAIIYKLTGASDE